MAEWSKTTKGPYSLFYTYKSETILIERVHGVMVRSTSFWRQAASIHIAALSLFGSTIFDQS